LNKLKTLRDEQKSADVVTVPPLTTLQGGFSIDSSYIQRINIIDSQSGLTVESIEVYSNEDGVKAATEAGVNARAWIAEQEKRDAMKAESNGA
jgi:hypothetical protein